MSKPYSCRAIIVLASVTIGSLLAGSFLFLTTFKAECGTLHGQQCYRDSILCPAEDQCYCFGFSTEFPRSTCKHVEGYWSHGAYYLIVAFTFEFWTSLIASITLCICNCCHEDDFEKTQDRKSATTEPFMFAGITKTDPPILWREYLCSWTLYKCVLIIFEIIKNLKP